MISILPTSDNKTEVIVRGEEGEMVYTVPYGARLNVSEGII